MDDNIHAGHRARLKQRFLEHGLESFSDIEAIELLLFHALPRRDTNELAHRLLERFGSFRGVMEADLSKLAQVPGMGENSAGLIRLVSEMNRRYLKSERSSGAVIRNSAEAGEYLLPRFAYLNYETVMVLCLDSRQTVISCHEVADGIVNRVDFSMREVIDIALQDNAVSMLIAHNHLSGTALPSKEDIRTTGQLHKALGYIGVNLADHIVVCDNDFVSMRDSGCFDSFI